MKRKGYNFLSIFYLEFHWENSSKDEYTFDVNGNPILDIKYNYLPSLPDWIIFDKTDRSFNSSNNQI